MADRKRQLVTQAEYAAMRGISRAAVNKRTATHGGPIPVHGPKKLIDPKEADVLWTATMAAGQARSGNSKADIPADAAPLSLEGLPPAAAGAGPTAQAKMASAIIKAQTEKIELEKLKGSLIDKGKALRQAFTFTRTLRDAWLNWPARVGPVLAAQFGADAHDMTVALETMVHEHLAQLVDTANLDIG